MRVGNSYAVDFGSDEVRIYSSRRDRTASEKNMIAVRKPDRVIAVGDLAYDMAEKNPPTVDVRTPVQNGRIADAERGGFVLDKLIGRLDAHRGITPSLYFSVPLGMSRIERKAYLDVGVRAGFPEGKIFLVDSPLAEGAALGIPLRETHGTMIVNIGAQHTLVAVIAGGQIVISRSFETGGRTIDESICDTVRRRLNVLIGMRTAVRLKYALGDMMERSDARRTIGMDTLSGNPREVTVPALLVRSATLDVMQPLSQEIRKLLERIPPQIAACVRQEGVYVTGGSARIAHLMPYLVDALGVKIIIPALFENTSIYGMTSAIRHHTIRDMAYPARVRT